MLARGQGSLNGNARQMANSGGSQGVTLEDRAMDD
jgi:hypothetical protein